MTTRRSRNRDHVRSGAATLRTLMPLLLVLAVPTGAATTPGAKAGPTAGTKAAAPAVTKTAAPPVAKTTAAPVPAPNADRAASADSARADDDGMTMKGGQEGTVFRSLTVEGEDRIHVEFERPALELDLDPSKAPGLTWGDAEDVLDRTTPDLAQPLLATSARDRCPYLGRPWLAEFKSGAVARFAPNFDGVARWRLLIANAKGETVASFEGKGNPPRTIAWDGRAKDGQPVTPGLTYSYAFEAFDRAGNKRNFVGEGFSVGAYRLETPDGSTLVFSGSMLGGTVSQARGRANAGSTPLVLLEAASWLNQSERLTQPLRVTATARSATQAGSLADVVTRALSPLLLGDPARVRAVTQVQPDAPEGGTVTIAAAR